MATERKIKEPVRLRQKALRNGNTSLYLDIYRNGRRSYEFLKLYLIPERTREDRERNRQTMQLANSIKSKRIVEMQNKEYGFKSDFAENTLFYPYYRAMCEKRLGDESRGNWGSWYSCLHHLLIYEKNEKVTFAEITPEWVQGFRDYLDNEAVAWAHDYRTRIKDKPLARNSKLSYFNKLRACLNQAFEDRIIPINPARRVENFKAEEGTRMYLTIEEIRKLAQTDCEYPRVKAAFLFSCLTGLRRSDILKLTWGDVYQQGDLPVSYSGRRRQRSRSILTLRCRRRNLWGSGADKMSRCSRTFIPHRLRTRPSRSGC